MKKVLITGASGQLGRELTALFLNHYFDVYGFSRQQMDVTNEEQVNDLMNEVQPDLVLHCAAYTKVDEAELQAEQAYVVNAYGTKHVAIAAERVGAKLVYVSTDYVFDGTGKEPYHECSVPSPLGVYGKSKLAGEDFVKRFHTKCFIVRTSWLYGGQGSHFVNTMLALGKEKKELSVVDDQIGSPTYVVDLAATILALIQTEKYGIYHVSNRGSCSWYEFAVAIFEEAGMLVSVYPCTSEDFPRRAKRPAYSVLKHARLEEQGFPKMKYWREGLAHFLNQEG
ncbi:dTDP-4-dehydrorhamnose reductase [Bacillus sp. CGMCC 1.16541]|uniref:dTDP-4-dehydrorhamnose reductase n=1 Tax=Bacillus sp. CGMCC 1.16541 TaxID=2185143 RepID=UPI000D728F21|nr:dTDP-4-dehydrorhamnose reductase [Bacillus sp. CGMCC 1.16541]